MVPIIQYCNTCIKCHKNFKNLPFLMNMSIKEINKSVNKDLKSLPHWLNANKTYLDVTKTEAVIFRDKDKVFDTDLKLKITSSCKIIRNTFR